MHWKLQADAHGHYDTAHARTYVATVPGGIIVRVSHEAREGRGPTYSAHPIPSSESMVFVPTRDASDSLLETARAFDSWFRVFIGSEAYAELQNPAVAAFRDAIK